MDVTLEFDATTQEGVHINSVYFTTETGCVSSAIEELAGGTAMIMLTTFAAQWIISISPPRQVLYATEGFNVSIVCIATDLKEKTVRWDHNDRQIANVAPPTTVFSDPADRSKYDIKGADPEGGNFSFTLLNYNKADAGVVTCDVAGVKPVSIRLETFVEPEYIYMTVNTPYREMTWNDGSIGIGLDMQLSHLVSCSVINSQPAATIRWLWNEDDGFTNLLNVTETPQTRDQLHNLTSTIELDVSLLYQSKTDETTSEDIDEISNMTIIEISDTDSMNGSVVDESTQTVIPEVFTEEEEQEIMSSGMLSCEVTVGDRVYVESVYIDFTDVNAGESTTYMTKYSLLIGELIFLLMYLD
ncbi:uncharacterized protein LOC144425874 [Styela clava]